MFRMSNYLRSATFGILLGSCGLGIAQDAEPDSADTPAPRQEQLDDARKTLEKSIDELRANTDLKSKELRDELRKRHAEQFERQFEQIEKLRKQYDNSLRRQSDEIRDSKQFIDKQIRNGFNLFLSNSKTELLGATFEPIDQALRSHLEIPKDQGLVITSVAKDRVAARAGLKENDILLSVNDKSVGKLKDLANILNLEEDQPATLKLLRSGKPLTLELKSEEFEKLSAASKGPSRYVLGIQARPIEDSLRAQLDLPKDQGVLIIEVDPDSPSAKGGLKAFDILLEADQKPVNRGEDLIELTQASKGKPMSLRLIRAGKPLEVAIAPDLRPIEEVNRFRFNIDPGIRLQFTPEMFRGRGPIPNVLEFDQLHLDNLPTRTERGTMGDLREEVTRLRGAIESLQRSIGREQGPPEKGSEEKKP